jgi:nucleoid-associated protein YgaU
VTRELKLALIVGFALVLVVTVLISDHLSHARQAELAGNVPAEPIKMAEPPIIAMGDPSPVLPAPTPTPTASNTAATPTPATTTAPAIVDPTGAPILAAAHSTDPEPSVLTQGRPTTSSGEHADLIETVKKYGGTVRDGTIFVTPQPAIRTVQDTVSPLPVEPTSPRRTAAPAAKPAAPSAPATPDRVHTVVAGDSAFKIAKQYYGDGKAWRKLATYNKLDDEAQLRVGEKLNIPSAEALLGKKATAVAAVTPIPSNVPGAGLHSNENVTLINPAVRTGPLAIKPPAPRSHTYTVKKGDTLAQIAKSELGSSKRAREIVELNKKALRDPDSLPLGAVLNLPSA